MSDDEPTQRLPVAAPGRESGGHEPTIRIHEVHKSFGSFDVLRGLTLDFPPDSITTVLGPSGTGKSVLLKHIVGLLRPDHGTVSVFGRDIWSLSEPERLELRKRFGLLFQDGALFGSMNVYDNVAYPLRKHTRLSERDIRERVMTSLRAVGLEDARRKTPNSISGGMKKRAGFARALILEPDVVMFDEPDSGLDPVRTSLLNDLILEVHRERRGTYIMVTHNISTARDVSDYVAAVWRGRLVHYGRTEEAFESGNPFIRQFLSGESAGPLGME